MNLLQSELLYKWIVTALDGLFIVASANFLLNIFEITDIEVIGSQTTISFYFASPSHVFLEVFDLASKRVGFILINRRRMM